MSDFISKVVTLCILFTMILACMGMVFTSQTMTSQRLILNEATEFLDRVSDKAYLTSSDMDEIYMELNSHGMLLDVDVERLIYAPINKDDTIISNYTKVDTTENLGVEIAGVTQGALHIFPNDRTKQVIEILFQVFQVVRKYQLGKIEPQHHIFIMLHGGMLPNRKSPEKVLEASRLVDVIIIRQSRDEQALAKTTGTEKHRSLIMLQQSYVLRFVHIKITAFAQFSEIRYCIRNGNVCYPHGIYTLLV